MHISSEAFGGTVLLLDTPHFWFSILLERRGPVLIAPRGLKRADKESGLCSRTTSTGGPYIVSTYQGKGGYCPPIRKINDYHFVQ